MKSWWWEGSPECLFLETKTVSRKALFRPLKELYTIYKCLFIHVSASMSKKTNHRNSDLSLHNLLAHWINREMNGKCFPGDQLEFRPPHLLSKFSLFLFDFFIRRYVQQIETNWKMLSEWRQEMSIVIFKPIQI